MVPREHADGGYPLLVEYFIAHYGNAAAKNIRRVSKATPAQLQGYTWPGNIRELQIIVERAIILADTDTFVVDETRLSRESTESPQRQASISMLSPCEVEMIEAVLAETHGRISGPLGAAAKLGIPRQMLDGKSGGLGIDKYGQKRPTSK